MKKFNLFKKISTFVFTMIFVLTLTATANATITVTHEPESLTFVNNSATMTFNISGFATGQEFEKTTYAIEHVTGISVRSTDYINGNSIASKVTFTKSTSIGSFPITVTVWYKENGETKNVKSNCSIMCYDSSYSQTTTKDDQVVGDQTTKLVTTDDIKIEYVGESTIMVGRNKPVSLPFKITSEKYNLREITFEPVAQSRGKYSISNVSDDDGSPERNIMCNVVAETDDLPTLVILVTVNYINGSERAYMIRTFDNIKVTMNPNDSIYNPDYDGIADGVYGDPDTLAEILNINDGIGAIVYDFAKVIAAILTFACVIFVGINIINARGKGEERSSAMQGLMYIAIGIIILDCVVLIYGLLSGMIGDPVKDLDTKISILNSIIL